MKSLFLIYFWLNTLSIYYVNALSLVIVIEIKFVVFNNCKHIISDGTILRGVVFINFLKIYLFIIIIIICKRIT